MRGLRLALVAVAALLDTGVAAAQNPSADCMATDMRFRSGRGKDNIEALQTCTKANVAMWLRVRAHVQLVSTYEKLKDTDAVIAELKVLTAPPFLDDALFNPPAEPLKTSLDDVLPATKYAGVSQVLLLAHLANAYLEKQQYQEAADAAARAIHQSNHVPGDVLDDEAEAWVARAYAMQGLNKPNQATACIVRAYVRGSNQSAVTTVISGQSKTAQDKLKALRDRMVTNGHLVGHWDAEEQAGTSKGFNPAAVEGLKAVREVLSDEIALVGPTGID